MKRRHAMPFGAAVLDAGVTRFRLWAPQARRVDLCFAAAEGPVLALEREGDGFFATELRGAPPGTLYRYRVDGETLVPDPASRFQPQGVHGPSCVVDPGAWDWEDEGWQGRPWEEAVVYELHVGTFSPGGGFAGVRERLPYLRDLGVTAIELMPVAAFPGERNWGYDGVLWFAPAAPYGGPEGLKSLVQAAHAAGLMVFLDVVYNHFGPEGNYLHLYAPGFFSSSVTTPWGAAINYDGEGSEWVRRFVVHNALYWLEEYHIDGLRLDAVHAIVDRSPDHILQELAGAVADGPGRDRRVHLILENDANEARYLAREAGGSPRWFTAQWNDDFHHAAHVLCTRETGGYYMDYVKNPSGKLGRALAEGFIYQGEPSRFRGGRCRGEPSAALPQTAFVNFLQNHDQIGNRAFGERIHCLAHEDEVYVLTAILLLAPSPPTLFMGQEWCAKSPFLFFCDFGPDLAPLVTEGRRREFASFPNFSAPESRGTIPDPCREETFSRSRLDWDELREPWSRSFHGYCKELLELRHRELVPRLKGMTRGGTTTGDEAAPSGLRVIWVLGDGSRMRLNANFDGDEYTEQDTNGWRVLAYVRGAEGLARIWKGAIPPWTACWSMQDAAGAG